LGIGFDWSLEKVESNSLLIKIKSSRPLAISSGGWWNPDII
jgi:hypothetical protein